MTPIKRAIRFVKRITVRHWGWIHFKVALGLGWGSAVLLVTPDSITQTVGEQSIQIWAIGTMLGGFISIVGILMTVARGERWKIRGLGVEIVGIILLGGGPLQYFLLQVGFLFDGQFTQRYQLTWFAYSMLAAIIVRGIIIIPQFIDVVVAIKEEKAVIARATGR